MRGVCRCQLNYKMKVMQCLLTEKVKVGSQPSWSLFQPVTWS